jgi:alkanesulfonate monooxygenase SsuD/methylene tetrahydromethanopterin reductase-like flavin-dependent oxidoreductase (luciferase family)
MAACFGVKFAREWPPDRLIGFARAVESAGLDELWLVEDLGFHGGFGPCGAALASTERVTVGLGIAPAVVRNPVYLAMEVASLAATFPGRFHMGLGHGVQQWIAQVGATPASWLQSLRETTVVVKQVTAGGAVSFSGEYVTVDNVELLHPASAPVSFGVRGPKGMALAGEVADGVIFAELCGPRYVERVRRDLGPASRFTVFVHASTDERRLRDMIDLRLSQPRFHGQLADYGQQRIDDWLSRLGAHADDDDPAREFGIFGPFETWPQQAQPWFDAGADSVVFCLPPEDDPAQVHGWQLRS